MADAAESTPAYDLDDPELYLNRELTWLAFNRRVLAEAADERTPLLERVKFLSITGSNLDEFFMKRIGGLRQQEAAGVHDRTVDGRTPVEQIEACYALVREQQREKHRLWDELRKRLADEGINVVAYDELGARVRGKVRQEYIESVYPLVTPQVIDPAHPFPFISNLSLNLLVTLREPGGEEHHLARVKVPVGAGAPRFVPVVPGEQYLLLEDVMAHNLDLLFPGMEVVACEPFRVTRNANTEKDEDHADDLLALIESELQERRFAPIVRLEMLPGADATHRGRLAAELGLDEGRDVFEVKGMLGTRDLMELASLDRPDLKDPPHHPVDHPSLQGTPNVFHAIRDARSVLLQHPYEAFSSSTARFLREAAHDPKVLAIKMTLYRTSTGSELVDHLIAAADNGKQVAAVVELKARFDEAANIRLANRMEEAGVHVTYGVVGLKTHCKVILVVRQDYSGLRRYVHIGTGNYHPGTSRLYSDMGLLTCDPDVGRDATELFNYLTTGFTPKRDYRKLLVAPKVVKKALVERIEREAALHSPKDPGYIRFKMNALEDADVTRALYEAARKGVRVDLIIRDSCRIRPGLPGLSETVRVVSIVGRFLEHARVYQFKNGGNEEIFIGSADAMKRNLEHRVEVLVPVEAAPLRRQVRTALDVQWADTRSAWEMAPDGSYHRPEASGRKARAVGSHQALVLLAEKRKKAASRLKKSKKRAGGRKTKNGGKVGRNLR